MSRRDSLLAVLVATVWGMSFIVAKWGLSDLPPLLLAALRLGGLAILAPLLPRPDLSTRTLLAFGSAWGTLQFGALFLALSLGLPAGLASVIAQSQVIFTTLLSVALRREALAAHHLVTAPLAVAGLVAVARSQGTHLPLAGFVAAIAAAIGWAISNVMVRRLASRRVNVSSLGFLSWAAIAPALSLLALSGLVEGPGAWLAVLPRITWRTGAVVAYQTLLASLGGALAWNYLLKRYPASTVSPFALLVPVVGTLAGRWAFGEEVAAGQWIGSALLLASVALTLLWDRLLRALAARPVAAPPRS